MRTWLLALVAITHNAFAEPACDVGGSSALSLLFGAQHVISKPKPIATSLFYSTVALRWELGAEVTDCDAPPIRVALSATIQSDNGRATFVPENPNGFSETATYLQFGGALEAQVTGPWRVRLGAERTLGDNSGGHWNFSLGGRRRSLDPGFVGLDLIVSTPCADCLSGTSVGFAATAGLDGRSTGAVVTSVVAAVFVGLLGVVAYAKSQED
jgi:hypothetical protein